MKKRIVLWGTDGEENKLLVALELLEKENKVNLITFKEEIATEEFYNQMMNIWREGHDLPFPEGHEMVERPLSVTEDLLPEDIKVDRTDVVTRAKAEWHFVVLSSKLYEMYNSELDDIKEKVEQLHDFDDKVWEEMKGFWEKVQTQMHEKNIFREHANKLKNKTNKIFDRLKDLRKIVEQRFREESREKSTVFKSRLDEIEEKIEKGLGLKPIFEELKNIQKEFKNETFARKDRKSIWDKLDSLFKKVKEKRFGDKGKAGGSGVSRTQRRYDGLVAAIQKMEKSIGRDKNEQEFQKKRISVTDGQLEAQIRQAKIKMIDERIRSKEEKLADMNRLKLELEKKLAVEKEREEQRKRQEEIKKAKEEAKAKIKQEMAEQSEDLDQKAEKLEKAAEKINEVVTKPKPVKKEQETVASMDSSADVESAKKDETSAPEKTEEINDPPIQKEKKEDISSEESVEAKGEEKVEETASSQAEKEEMVLESDEDTSSKDDAPKKKESMVSAITEAVGESLEDMVDTVKAVAEVVGDRIEETIDDMTGEEE